MSKDQDIKGLAPSGVLSSGQGVCLTASRGDPNDDRSYDADATPPLGVKLTVYRLLNMTIMFSFCLAYILNYKGQSTVPMTLDWISGGVLVVVLYWVGLYEGRVSQKWEWFFQFDLAPAIGYCTKRAVGGALWLLFAHNLLIISIDTSVTGLVGGLPYCFLSHNSAVYTMGIICGTAVLLLGFQYCLNTLTQHFQARARATGLVIDYGPSAPLAAQYGWLGVVGTVVGLLCSVALAGLPVVASYFTFSLTCPRPQTTTP